MKMDFRFSIFDFRFSGRASTGSGYTSCADAAQQDRKSQIANRKSLGFNLIEVMFSILILGVGLSAVVSLIPVAGTIQQRTMDDVVARTVKLNARTLINTPGDNSIGDQVKAGLDGVSNAAKKSSGEAFDWPGFDAILPIADRGFPADNPSVYWVPIFRWDKKNNGWEVYILIVKPSEGSAPPTSSDDLIIKGGRAYLGEVVIDARPDALRLNEPSPDRSSRYADEGAVETDNPIPDGYYHAAPAGRRSSYLDHTYLNAIEWNP